MWAFQIIAIANLMSRIIWLDHSDVTEFDLNLLTILRKKMKENLSISILRFFLFYGIKGKQEFPRFHRQNLRSAYLMRDKLHTTTVNNDALKASIAIGDILSNSSVTWRYPRLFVRTNLRRWRLNNCDTRGTENAWSRESVRERSVKRVCRLELSSIEIRSRRTARYTEK